MRISSKYARGVVALSAAMLLITACGSGNSKPTAGHVMTASMSSKSSGVNRTYSIAADVVDWDYAPSGKNLITGEDFDDVANVFVARDEHRIGHVYRKSLYREYTDDTFKTLKPREKKWEHLGMLGPVIQAEVGDTITVHFKNNTPYPANVHPHGVFYAKDSEGTPYADGTSGSDKADDEVPSGGTHTYHWKVPERAGPGPADGSSVMWMYMSHTDEPADTYSGLIGPMIVTAKGKARADGSPKDVDRQFVTMFEVSDENQSRWLQTNADELGNNVTADDIDSDEFGESNLMHSINGYVYGNLPGLTMKKGEHVRWYVMGMGTEVDLHTPHWHGNTVTTMGMRTDVVSVLPGSMVVADMVPDDRGTWMFHCHVNDHIIAGMMALYTVK